MFRLGTLGFAGLLAATTAALAQTPTERGQYLVNSILACGNCHTPKTASGEQFKPSELTAAHRTLPFGTRLRVTNVATGQSVTVRINDRGPFVPGRVIDVAHSAAEELGMIDRGITKVKLEVEK